jgi:hypothetical protein
MHHVEKKIIWQLLFMRAFDLIKAQGSEANRFYSKK